MELWSLGEPEKSNRWDQVDDFNWLRSDQPSPNWDVLPPQQRLGSDTWRELTQMSESPDLELKILSKTVDRLAVSD